MLGRLTPRLQASRARVAGPGRLRPASRPRRLHSFRTVMPELPEVETTCNGVRPHAEGRVLSALVVRNPRLRQPVPEDLPARIVGARLLRVSRRAKYLLLDFGAGTVI